MRPAASAPVDARAKVWLDRDGRVVLSEWRIQLLEAVRDTGSLAAAAHRLGVPYRTAWYKLHEIETELGVRLVVSRSGGAEGGGSSLTTEAEDIIRRFHRVSGGLSQLVRKRFRAAFPELKG
ncbi:MAG: LysR family transcriptional regulator [Chloroflexi bacterium]|nr:MAG: LysR family transcriptional regulator [Chloroflexota bacterium]